MIPIYIYCTKAKPYLQSGIFHGEGIKYLLSDRQSEYVSLQDLNGLVVARCECKMMFRFTTKETDGRIYISRSYLSNFELSERSCLTNKQLNGYGKGRDLFAYHLEQVEALEKPMQISDFYSDEACTKPLTRAPQSYQKAYKKYRWSGGYVVEPCYLFSDRSPFVCKILNGEKDLEIRKSLIKEVNKNDA